MSVEQLLKDVDTEIKATNKAIAMFQESHAPLFKLIDFMDIVREIKLSKFFLFLMDKKGTHGQGTKYLKLFLEMLSHAYSNFPKIFVDDEKKIHVESERLTTDKRRADFAVDIGNFEMLFENKPWAPDGKNQVRDYKRYVENRNAVIVYIGQQDPTENSIPATELNELKIDGKFFRISFDDISYWIKCCIQETKPDKVRYFLSEVNEFIENEFMNTTELSNQEIITLMSKNISSSFKISNSLKQFKVSHLEKFLVVLEKALDQDGFLIDYQLHENNNVFSSKEALLEMKPSASFLCYRKEEFAQQKKRGYAVRFSFEKGDLNGLIWGISRIDDKLNFQEQSGLIQEIRNAMNNEFRNIKKKEEQINTTTWWPWYSNAEYIGIPNNWSTESEAWERMNLPYEDEKSIVRIVVENAKKAIEALENIQA